MKRNYTKTKLIEENKINKYLFFWKPNKNLTNETCFSQWQPSLFEIDGVVYNCAEQYMMSQKAKLFKDEYIYDLVMDSIKPQDMIKLGRKVKNFNESIWDKNKYSIIFDANYNKFSQNEKMKKFLLSTNDKVIVEASPYDKVWGVGMDSNNRKIYNPNNWRGENLLGFIIMEVRDLLK